MWTQSQEPTLDIWRKQRRRHYVWKRLNFKKFGYTFQLGPFIVFYIHLGGHLSFTAKINSSSLVGRKWPCDLLSKTNIFVYLFNLYKLRYLFVFLPVDNKSLIIWWLRQTTTMITDIQMGAQKRRAMEARHATRTFTETFTRREINLKRNYWWDHNDNDTRF